MALKSELMTMGLPASLAKRLGFDPVTAVTAAGSSTTDATVLSTNNAKVTNTNGQGVRIPDVEQEYLIEGSTSSLKVYPVSGGNFIGQSADAAISVGAAKVMHIIPTGSTTDIPYVLSA